MKGYLFSALTVLMFMSLFTLTYYFYARGLSSARLDIQHEKASMVFDDARSDVEDILNLTVELNNSAKATFRFHDTVPAGWNISEAAGLYAAFINTTYARELNSVMYLDAGGLSSSTNPVDFTIHPFRYSYGYGNLSKREVWLRNRTLAQEPESINLTIDLSGEWMNDLVWLEAESLDGADTVVENEGASEDRYLQDFTLASTTVSVPFQMSYTLWVRAVYDNSSKNFTVEVDGRNSTRFDVRDESATSLAFRWFNDTKVTFNLTAGSKIMKVYPGPGSTTESVDVILLTSEYLNLDNEAPIIRPADPAEVYNATGGDLETGLTILFQNVNYTYGTDSLSRTALSEWNFTFNDDDSLRINLGGVTAGVGSYSSMRVRLDDSANGSRASMDTAVRFPAAGGRAYVDGNCTLRMWGPIGRHDRIWLAKG